MNDFQVGDKVKVIRSIDPHYSFTIGHIGTIVGKYCSGTNNRLIGIHFDVDEEWADSNYVCEPGELELVERH